MKTQGLCARDYRNLVESAPILIWRAGLTAECDYFNGRWLAFTGRTLAQELGNGWADGVHPEDRERCLAVYRAAFDSRVAFEMEYRLRRHDGAFRWILDKGNPYSDDRGAFAGYIGSCVDITEAVEARETIRLAHETEVMRLQRLLPICAGCKEIRDEAGAWHAVEAYLQEKTDSGLTHTLCPTCMAAFYPEDT